MSANMYIMCNNVDRVLCILATWYCYMLNFGLHFPDTECSPSPEDDITARVASKQERKITCIVTGFLWKYTVSKAILRMLFRNKNSQTVMHVYIIWYNMCGFGKSENNRSEIILRNHAVQYFKYHHTSIMQCNVQHNSFISQWHCLCILV